MVRMVGARILGTSSKEFRMLSTCPFVGGHQVPASEKARHKAQDQELQILDLQACYNLWKPGVDTFDQLR